MAAVTGDPGVINDALIERYLTTRARSLELCESLSAEDCVVQTMADVSPTKWHLAHLSWFFEAFVLVEHATGYEVYDERFHYLFNSYYYTAGEMHPRPQRGRLSRPTLSQVIDYRRYVDDALIALLQRSANPRIAFLVELGLNHERQHQELMLTDIKHVLWCNPMKPAMRDDLAAAPQARLTDLRFEPRDGGVNEIGIDAGDVGFCFDNETPRHSTLVQPHALANRLVTNGEYREFLRDGGYGDSALWLSDGWDAVQRNNWQGPLYWSNDQASEYTLGGERELDLHAPVAHISFYEAEAFARWAGMRLPREAEWELAANGHPFAGNFAETDFWHPVAGDGGQWFGDVWEWTSSPYSAYPGFKPLAGSLGEYNGKFMCNQMVVRGGSCVSAADHIRPSYRSFFYPDARWQFLGLRLAKDL